MMQKLATAGVVFFALCVIGGALVVAHDILGIFGALMRG